MWIGWVVGHDYGYLVDWTLLGLSVCELGWIGSKKMDLQPVTMVHTEVCVKNMCEIAVWFDE